MRNGVLSNKDLDTCSCKVGDPCLGVAEHLMKSLPALGGIQAMA